MNASKVPLQQTCLFFLNLKLNKFWILIHIMHSVLFKKTNNFKFSKSGCLETCKNFFHLDFCIQMYSKIFPHSTTFLLQCKTVQFTQAKFFYLRMVSSLSLSLQLVCFKFLFNKNKSQPLILFSISLNELLSRCCCSCLVVS